MALGLETTFLSTDKAVEPVNAYGASKMLAERIVLAEGGRVVRYGNVLGSRGSIVPVFRARVAAGLPILVTDPDATRFVMTLDQAVELVRDAVAGASGLYIARDLPAATVASFVEAVAPPLYPRRVTGLRPGEKVHEKLDDGYTSDMARRLTAAELRDLLDAV